MVINGGSLAENLVGSSAYRELLTELVDATGIEVELEYAEVFARLDSAKILKAKVDIDDLTSILTSKKDLIRQYSLSKFQALSDEEEEEEYPVGAEPSGDERSKTLSVGKYSQGFLLTNLIEFALAMSGRECLLEYIKLCRIPHAKKYTDQIIKLTGLG
ncbi:hypothetical protein PPUJ20005_53570 [Pseudomonas putida]|uniref:hypothetical protein n=1 Tax=Pseudomonas putida TaxID=303 RepID=UPI00235CDC52|nr:hypothetical protein [Pseudomonas putida]GLO11385.1 hypothetical protein PPUJ20005_53570 [Pseudomonas putida]HDS0988636.1 hypothetical protein [Pseudomonas putida]